MAHLIAIVAPSGSGKSTSLFPHPSIGIKGLNPKETLFINVAGKPLPVKGALKLYPPDIHPKNGGNYVETSEPDKIQKILDFADSDSRFKNVILDDAGYIMGFDTMNRAQEKGYEKWTDLASKMFQIINKARGLRRDLNIICTFHQEVGKDNITKIKTSGQLLDNTIYLDGLFTFIFYGEVQKDFKSGKVQYFFRTKSDGTSTCKTPVDCFEEELIPNDMGYVIDKIKEYYES